MNDGELLPQNAMLVVIDVIGLYDNIPPKEGVKCVARGLKESPSSKVPAELIERLLQIILDYLCLNSMGRHTSRDSGPPWEQSQPRHVQTDSWQKK